MSTRQYTGDGVTVAAADPDAIARAYVAMWNERDYAAIPRLVSDSFVMYDPAAPEAGVPGPRGEVHGRDGLEAFMRLLTTAFPDFEITVLDLLTGTDIAMYEVQLTMTHEGPLGSLPPTGRRVEVRGVSVLRLEDGRVSEHRFHTNMQDSVEQLGLTFPQVLGHLPSMLLWKLRSSFFLPRAMLRV
jgi:steroid delta-isomerase-like uncharacterized protein